jgi:HEPN domain-containing protein
MKNVDMAEAYASRAERCLWEAQAAMRHGDYPGVVRRAQECVELSLKSILRLYGVEYPREHDPSRVLLQLKHRFPEWFAVKLDEFGEISAELAKHRGPSVYGDEEKGVPPSELFGEKEAKSALGRAKSVYRACKKLSSDFLKKCREHKKI